MNEKIPELTTSIPFEVLINGEEYLCTSISEQNYASILRGTATEIDDTLRFTFTKIQPLTEQGLIPTAERKDAE